MNNPPKLAVRALRWFCPPDLQESILGDLEEQYKLNLTEHGVVQARVRFIWNVLRFFRPGIVFRRKLRTYRRDRGMFRNFVKVGFRNLLRNRTFATINVLGLSLGIGIAICLFSIVRFEKSFDAYHEHGDRVFQILRYHKHGGSDSHTPYGAIHALRTQVPEVERAGVILKEDHLVIDTEHKKFLQDHIYFVEPQVLHMIDVEWIEGSSEKSLSQPYQAVLDEETAVKLFGNDPPVGQVIRYNNSYDLTVTGIIKKAPANTDFQFKMLISMATLKQNGHWETETYWKGGSSLHHGYVQLKEGASRQAAEDKLNQLYQAFKEKDDERIFGFENISRMHFEELENDNFNYDIAGWLPDLLAYIGVFLILMACINFINLTTVQAVHRHKEIAVRKMMGSSRKQLVWQFLIETGLIVAFSLILAVPLAQLIIHYSDLFLNTRVAHAPLWDWQVVLFLISTGVGVTLLAGFYPAIILSGFQPIRILRSGLSTLSRSRISLRQVLVIFQFVIAQVMVIAILVGMKQIRYFYSKDLGFDQEAVVTVAMPERDNLEKQEHFKRQLLSHPQIREVTYGLTAPSVHDNQWWGAMKYAGIPEAFGTRIQYVDLNYFDFYGLELIAGRSFLPSDTAKVTIVNEKATRRMGFTNPEDALGQSIEGWPGRFSIVGVIRDFHSQNLREEIVPHAYLYAPWNFQTASIRIDPRQTQAAVELIEAYWSTLFPDNFFELRFLTDEMKRFYEDERKFSNFLGLFAIVSIFIGSLGLYGLVYFVCITRTKEIGVRKVLGSTVSGVVLLLSKNFLWLLLSAFSIASGLGWYLMNEFLQNYAYRITIGWKVFALAAAISMGIGLVPVWVQSIRAARKNPVESLRYE